MLATKGRGVQPEEGHYAMNTATATAINTELLEPILQDLVALVGLHHTMTLVQAYGGVRLYVPKLELEDDHYLVRLIGRSAAEKLQAVYAGETHFDIPKAERALRAVRDEEIRAKRKQFLNKPQSGVEGSVRYLALEYRLTERHIRTICGELEDDKQVGLF